MLALVGCSPALFAPAEFGEGASKADVIASYGQPDRVQNFILPEEPFFGPQEGLVNLVPAGTVIEEWVYENGDDVFFVWFAGEEGALPEDWRVLSLASYPRDAVY